MSGDGSSKTTSILTITLANNAAVKRQTETRGSSRRVWHMPEVLLGFLGLALLCGAPALQPEDNFSICDTAQYLDDIQ